MIDNSMDSYQSRESDNDNNDRLKRGIQQDLSPNGHSISYGNGAIINDNSIDNATNYNSHTQITPNHDMLLLPFNSIHLPPTSQFNNNDDDADKNDKNNDSNSVKSNGSGSRNNSRLDKIMLHNLRLYILVVFTRGFGLGAWQGTPLAVRYDITSTLT